MSTEVNLPEKMTPTTQVRPQRYLRPHYDVSGDQDAYTVRVYMPGVPKEGVELTLDREHLHIEGRRSSTTQEGWEPVFREIAEADYRLQLDLNIEVDDEKIEARTENGVLTLRLPVAESAKPRSIQVD